LRRWWRFIRLTRSPDLELALPTTHSTPAARQQAVWELFKIARGIRRRTWLPQTRTPNG
jgi:hypothetical protein